MIRQKPLDTSSSIRMPRHLCPCESPVCQSLSIAQTISFGEPQYFSHAVATRIISHHPDYVLPNRDVGVFRGKSLE